jgi:hypothetical protein
MTTDAPTWAIVATVDEPATLIAAFVRHHLAIGASEVHLYLDRPHPDLAPLIAGLAGCFVTLCDDAYWAASPLGARPPHHVRRQKYNANAAFHLTRCGWLLHCDADEFVCDAAGLCAGLARLQDKTDPVGSARFGLKLHNRERVWGPEAAISDAAQAGAATTWDQTTVFSGCFRFPTELYDELIRDLFKPFGQYLNRGLSGHAAGKTVSRVGAPLDIGIHSATERGTHDTAKRAPSEVALYHFDGLTPLHYILKMLKRGYETPNGPRKRAGHQRLDQARFIRKHAGDADKMRRFVRRMKSINAAQAERYRTVMALDEAPFVVQGCAGLDLSASAFDADLRRHNGAFFEHAGLAYWGD